MNEHFSGLTVYGQTRNAPEHVTPTDLTVFAVRPPTPVGPCQDRVARQPRSAPPTRDGLPQHLSARPAPPPGRERLRRGRPPTQRNLNPRSTGDHHNARLHDQHKKFAHCKPSASQFWHPAERHAHGITKQ